jgi:Arc/MetJ-type ribon-helix-helix transcriptional regulator
MKAATKVSISVPQDIARFVEEYQESHELPSRSEVFVEAVRVLRERELAEAYKAASAEWDNSEDSKLWEQTTGDGL